jgi:hypothetical protein
MLMTMMHYDEMKTTFAEVEEEETLSLEAKKK